MNAGKTSYPYTTNNVLQRFSILLFLFVFCSFELSAQSLYQDAQRLRNILDAQTKEEAPIRIKVDRIRNDIAYFYLPYDQRNAFWGAHLYKTGGASLTRVTDGFIYTGIPEGDSLFIPLDRMGVEMGAPLLSSTPSEDMVVFYAENEYYRMKLLLLRYF